MYKVLALKHQGVIWVPISSNCQYLARTSFHRHYIRLGNLVGVIAFFVVYSLNYEVSVDFKYGVPVVVGEGVTTFFCFFLFNVGAVSLGLPKVYVYIKPSRLKFFELILGLTHNMRDPLCTLHGGGAVGHNHIFWGHK